MNVTMGVHKIEVKSLCICVFDNIALVYLDMMDAISARVNIVPTFLLAFQDEEIERILEERGYEYFTYNWRRVNEKTKWLVIPLLRHLVRELFYYRIYKNLLSKLGTFDYDVLWTSDGTRTVGKYMLRRAKKNRTPSFLYDYGIATRNPTFLKMAKRTREHGILISFFIYLERKVYTWLLQLVGLLPRIPLSHLNMGWDYLLVRAEIDKGLVIQNYGIPENQVKVIGSIWSHKMDKLKNERFDRPPFLGRDDRIILVILSDSYKMVRYTRGVKVDEYFGNLEKLLSSLSRYSGNKDRIVAKFHPKDDLRLYDDLRKEYGDRITWVEHKEYDTLKLIFFADLVISQASTTILDALYMKKKIIFYPFQNGPCTASYGNLFKNEILYDPSKTIGENISAANRQEIDSDEYRKHLEDIDFEKEFSKFMINLKERKTIKNPEYLMQVEGD